MHSLRKPEHTAVALKMPDLAQSGLAEPVHVVRPSEDPPSPAYSDTRTLEYRHKARMRGEAMSQNIPHETSAAIQLDMKPVLDWKPPLCDAPQFSLGAACHIK